MESWVSVVAIVVAVLAVGMAKERWRAGGMQRWAQSRGLAVRAPFVPGERPPCEALTRCFHPRGALRWGFAVEGELDGAPVTIAEHEMPRAGDDRRPHWFTLVAFPAPGTGGLRLTWRKPSKALFLRDPGDPLAVRPHVRDAGGPAAEGDPFARERWLTEARARAFDEWPHGGEIAVADGFCGWCLPGMLSASRLDEMARRLPEVRKLAG